MQTFYVALAPRVGAVEAENASLAGRFPRAAEIAVLAENTTQRLVPERSQNSLTARRLGGTI